MRRVWLVLCVLCACAAKVKDPALIRRSLAEPARYSVLTTLLMNGAERRDRDVGYRLKTELHVAPVPQDSQDVLLRFQLVGTELLVRGKHRSAEWESRRSLWDSTGGEPWLARIDEGGAVKTLMLPTADSKDVRNYKRALTSLFQFEADTILDAAVERNETDISGACDVLYEAAASGARKIKRACSHDARAAVSARRITRYTLDPTGALGALHAEEVVTLEQAVKIRSWHEFTYVDNKARSSTQPDLELLEETQLGLEGSPVEEEEDQINDLKEAIELHATALGDDEAGAGGDINSARALLALLPALSKAEQRALEQALSAAEAGPPARLAGLCRALGLVGTPAAARAAASFLRLDAREPLVSLAHHYLAGFALSHAPHADAVLHVLRLAERAKHESIQDAAFLAVAAAGARSTERGAVRDAVTRGLTRCKTDTCRAARLLALGNLRVAAADVLIGSAGSDAPSVASAALSALRYAPDVTPAHLRRLGRMAINTSLPLEVRAAALDLVVQKRAASEQPAAPLQVLELAVALHSERGAAAHELRRVLWQRLDSLSDAQPVRSLMPLLPRKLTTWDARAHAGTSHVLTRALGWAGGAGKWRAALDSAQVARGGVLRRGAVTLTARPPGGAASDELQVEVWTRGLHALTGGGEDEPEEDMEGGLALSVAGARLPDVTLFSGQAELLGHVWSGTGSSPTAVVRGARVARWTGGSLPLAAGVWTQSATRAAISLALDAHATVSLWQRTARAGLSLRGGLTAHASTHVRVPWADLRARRSFTAEPRLRIALDLDFYSGMALCVRSTEPAHEVSEELKLSGVVGARGLNVTRGAEWKRVVAGRTLALGRDNDVACRTLRAADEDEE